MAAPTYSGVQRLSDFADSSTYTIDTGTTISSISLSGSGHLRHLNILMAANIKPFQRVIIPCQGGPINTVGKYFSFRTASSGGSRYFSANFRFVDSSGNYNEYQIFEDSRRNPVIELFDLETKATFATSGVFDPTDLSDIEILVARPRNETQQGILFYVPIMFSGVIAQGGDSDNQVNFQGIHDYVDANSSSTTSFQDITPSGFYESPHTLLIGDNTALYFNNGFVGGLAPRVNQGVGFIPTGFNNSASNKIELTDSKRTLIINSTRNIDIPNQQIDTYGVSNISTGVVIFRGFIFNNNILLEFGTGELGSCQVTNSPVPIKGGALFRGTDFILSTAQILIDWNGQTVFDAVDCTNTFNDHFIRIGADNVANNAQIDVSDIDFGTPGITHFLIDGVTGIEITTATGASLTKTEINGGTATFLTPQPTVTVTAVNTAQVPIAGAAVYMETSPGAVEVLNGETDTNGEITANYSGSTPQAVVGWVRSGSGPLAYVEFPLGGSITSSGYNQTAILQEDS